LKSIEYRNLAPLYCDEEMRICGLEKKKSQNGSIYEVWIEGPTGGVAVKGTVHTTVKNTPTAGAPIVPTDEPQAAGPRFKRPEHPAFRHRMWKVRDAAAKLAPASEGSDQDHNASREKILSQDLSTPPSTSRPTTASESTTSPEPPANSEPPSQPQGEIPNMSAPAETTSQPSSREVTSVTAQATGRAYRRNRATNMTAYNFVTLPPSKAPSPRLVDSYKPVKPTLSVRSRELLRRALRHAPPEIAVRPIPLVRRSNAKPYTPDPVRTASRHSRFLREGVRKIDKVNVRFVAELSERAERRNSDVRYIQK
jgi:hypothetical protein